jgi:hypothetical protein
MAVDEALPGVRLLRDDPAPRGGGVLVDAFLGRRLAVALAEAAVVDRDDRETEAAQVLDAAQVRRQVPAHAVQVEQRRRPGVVARPVPGEQALGARLVRDRQVELADVGRQAREPARYLADGPERELALLRDQRRAAGAEEHGQREQRGACAAPGTEAMSHARCQSITRATKFHAPQHNARRREITQPEGAPVVAVRRRHEGLCGPG